MAKKRLSKRNRYLYISGIIVVLIVILLAVMDKYNIPTKISKIAKGQYHKSGKDNPEITKKLDRLIPDDAPFPYFTDVTKQAGLTFEDFKGATTFHLPEKLGSGVAWGDIDNDGDDDLFLVSTGGPYNAPSTQWAPCKLYENQGNGTFIEYTNFPDTRIMGAGAAFGDFNGDGWQDLVVTGFNHISLYINVNGDMFRRDPDFPNLNKAGFLNEKSYTGVAVLDYDNDKDIDIYVCGYIKFTERDFKSRPKGPLSYPPVRNLLFQNDGNGRFREVAEELGVSDPKGLAFCVLPYDFNNDGWMDIYVGNDLTPNAFFLNLEGNFKEISVNAGVIDYRGAMGLTAGDFDSDGDSDFYISHWWTEESALYESFFNDLPLDDTEKSAHTIQNGQKPRLHFKDTADLRGLGQISIPFVGWGTEFVDLDNDGWLDLVVANGGLGLVWEEGTPKELIPMRPFLFWNEKGKLFHDLGLKTDVLSTPHVGRGLAVSDFDDDGRMDILIYNKGEGVQLFRNEMKSANCIKLRLKSFIGKGNAAIGFGDGSTVIAHVGSKKFKRCVSSVSYLSQSSKTLHIGLGDADNIDLLEVKWLGGEESRFKNLSANQTWEIIEGDPVPRPVGQIIARHDIMKKVKTEGEKKSQIVNFWSKQRAAIKALKTESNVPKAIKLFQEALSINPNHNDSNYYLGMCYLSEEMFDKAMKSFEELIQIEPSSHRGYQELGKLHASIATTADDMEIAMEYLQKSYDLNRSETGIPLMLAEIELLYGTIEAARESLIKIVRTNTKSEGGFFLLGYISWKLGSDENIQKYLNDAKTARKGKPKTKGVESSEEGDVKKKMYHETTLLSQFWNSWNGETQDYLSVFSPLDNYLDQKRNDLGLVVPD